jgi:hypothetical protein
MSSPVNTQIVLLRPHIPVLVGSIIALNTPVQFGDVESLINPEGPVVDLGIPIRCLSRDRRARILHRPRSELVLDTSHGFVRVREPSRTSDPVR